MSVIEITARRSVRYLASALEYVASENDPEGSGWHLPAEVRQRWGVNLRAAWASFTEQDRAELRDWFRDFAAVADESDAERAREAVWFLDGGLDGRLEGGETFDQWRHRKYADQRSGGAS